ncbi:MAG: amino acid adenylation domain-containing protein, partial [Acidobacteria bacterium]|nr:amino acid adenylation domain-containing protein [Acidobacteriota bacterium]
MLIEKGVLPDDIIAIMMERSIEMITGILGILKSGTAYLPIDPQSPPDRIQYILKDSAAAILVIDDDEKKKKINCQLTIVNYQLSMSFSPHSLSGIQYSNLAYIIYTSGSTGKPKGVPITHANVTPLLLWGHHRLGIGTNDRTMQNLACHFDWSVWEIFITLITGAILNIVSNELLLSGSEGASYFKRHNITILHATPTQYQLIISSGNKFETLKYLFLGAEKLSLELLKHSLVSVQQDCRVFNMYGPTEAAIISAVLEMKSNHVAEFTNLSSVPIGQPVANGRLLILDNDWHICPMNIMGELYIGGGGVAPGYLNNPELTAERFKRNVISQWSFVNGKFQRNDNSLKFSNDQCPMTNDRLYKTGDLARWLTNGNIEFLGRIDHQVKIRGFRIELGEIESRLAKHKTVRDVVVINQSLNGDQYLCAYIVPLEPAGFEKEELRNYLAGQLPHYMVPAYWVSLEKIPLNANGKINLRALPQPDYVSESVFEPPANETENMLAAIWSDILGIEKIKVSVHDNFFRLGGHSLKATIMLARIQKSFAVKLSMAQIFNFPTIQKLAGIIAKTGKKFQYDLEPIEKKEYYELSYNQKRLWIINQWDPQGTAFNMPGTIPLNHNADITSIKKTLQCISERHESLKTAFIIVANEPVQYIAQKIDVPFEIKDLSLLPDKEKQLTRQQLYLEISTAPFELETPPLFRTRLVKLNPDHYELMYNIHHIIADGWSLEILQKEFSLIYESYRLEKPIEMEPLLVQYKDFAAWHNKHLNCINDVSYQSWKNKLIQEVPILKLPADFTNNPNDKRGASYRCLIDTESTDRLKKLAR